MKAGAASRRCVRARKNRLHRHFRRARRDGRGGNGERAKNCGMHHAGQQDQERRARRSLEAVTETFVPLVKGVTWKSGADGIYLANGPDWASSGLLTPRRKKCIAPGARPYDLQVLAGGGARRHVNVLHVVPTRRTPALRVRPDYRCTPRLLVHGGWGRTDSAQYLRSPIAEEACPGGGGSWGGISHRRGLAK